MDARTYIDTKVTGHTLDAKRQAAAEARQAKLARRQTKRQTGHETGTPRLERVWNSLRNTAMWKKLKGVVVGSLLAATLVVPVVADTSPATVRGGGSMPAQTLVERSRSSKHHMIARRGPARAKMMVRRSGPVHWQAIRTRPWAATM